MALVFRKLSEIMPRWSADANYIRRRYSQTRSKRLAVGYTNLTNPASTERAGLGESLLRLLEHQDCELCRGAAFVQMRSRAQNSIERQVNVVVRREAVLGVLIKQ
jgi:hypothetical protein